MSLKLAALMQESEKKNLSRAEILALMPPKEYNDGRTIQSHKDETDIVKIMARYHRTETISHLAKHEGVYGDFSDFDFHKQIGMLTRGREIFDDLPAELRREFGQSPAAFFEYVNDPKNVDDLRTKLPALAKPGQQLAELTLPSADLDAAKAVVKAAEDAAKPPAPASEPVPTPTTAVASGPPPPPAGDA